MSIFLPTIFNVKQLRELIMNSAATPVVGEDANNGSYLSVEPVAVVGVDRKSVV